VLAFVMGSQHFEHAIEPSRRLDPPVAEDNLVKMLSLRAHEIYRRRAIRITASSSGNICADALAALCAIRVPPRE